MKNILENEKVFEAYATIDLCYYMLKDLYKNLSKSRSPIAMMIDEATGFSKAKKKDVISLLEQIIEAKQFIGADCTSAAETLMKVRGLA